MPKLSELFAAAFKNAGIDVDPETFDDADPAASTTTDAPQADAAAISAAEAKGRAAGVAAERKRWGDVLGSEHAENQIELAVSLLVAEDGKLGAEAIVGVLKTSAAKTPATPAADEGEDAAADADADPQASAMRDRLSKQKNPDTGRGKSADLGAEQRKKIREASIARANRNIRKPGKKG